MKNLKSKNGISLIVLVLTIIVMIILATAIILSLNNSGIIGKANKAKQDSDTASLKEYVNVLKAEWTLDEEKIKDENSDITSFSEYAAKRLKEAGYKTEGEGSYEVTDNGDIYKYPVIPEGFIVSDIEGENTVSGGLVIYEGTEKVSTDTDAKTTRNQFVWVPVPDISEFVREDGYINGVKQTYVSSGEATEPFSKEYETGKTLSLTNDLTGEWAEYTAMRASVEKYGGFYIGRYETGADGAVVYPEGGNYYMAEIQEGWGVSMTDVGTEGAVYIARSVYPDSSSVVSTLIYGEEWDAAVRFICKTKPNFDKDSSENAMYIYDKDGNEITELTSKGWTVPGYSGSFNNGCNIYDMAGECAEWTMEAYGTNGRILRGGSLFGSPVSQPISYRRYESDLDYGMGTCARVALYLK